MKPTNEQVRDWAIRCGDEWGSTLPEDKRFLAAVAALAYAAGLERAATRCDEIHDEYEGEDVQATWCAEAIRALGDDDE